jgi:predicted transcriptional regulator
MGPEDIELGEGTVRVERRPKAGVVVSVRLAPEEADQLEEIAERRGVPLSRVAREAIVTYLTRGPLAQPAVAPWTVASTAGALSVRYSEYGVVSSTTGLRVRARAEETSPN